MYRALKGSIYYLMSTGQIFDLEIVFLIPGEGEHSLTSDIRSEFGLDGTLRSQFSRTDCVCPFSFHPVCGADGRNYPNQCAATCR